MDNTFDKSKIKTETLPQNSSMKNVIEPNQPIKKSISQNNNSK